MSGVIALNRHIYNNLQAIGAIKGNRAVHAVDPGLYIFKAIPI